VKSRVPLSFVNEQEDIARRLLNEAGYFGFTGKNTFSRIPGSTGVSDYLDLRIKGLPYLGMGLGSQSYTPHLLGYNMGAKGKDMGPYMDTLRAGKLPIQDLYRLSLPAAMGKMVSVSFYYGGIYLDDFEKCFGIKLSDAFPDECQFLMENKLMQLEENRFQLTDLGKKHFGGVVALFYSPAVQKKVLELEGGEVFAPNQFIFGNITQNTKQKQPNVCCT